MDGYCFTDEYWSLLHRLYVSFRSALPLFLDESMSRFLYAKEDKTVTTVEDIALVIHFLQYVMNYYEVSKGTNEKIVIKEGESSKSEVDHSLVESLLIVLNNFYIDQVRGQEEVRSYGHE